MDREEGKGMIQPIKDYCQCGHSRDKHLIREAAEFDSLHRITYYNIEFDCLVCLADNCKCGEYIQREYVVKDNNGVEWHILNIAKFVRENQSLFSAEDCLMRNIPCSVYRKGLAGKYSRAETGLGKVIAEEVKSWKGWKLVSRTEKRKCKTISKD